jgi:hypothetical protein
MGDFYSKDRYFKLRILIMARRKRLSPVLEKATLRVAGMRSMTESLDFGNGLSLEAYEQQMNTFQQTLLNYNTLLSTVDEVARQVDEQEKALNRSTEMMLLNMAARYGRDSAQYLQAGGKARRKSGKRSVTPAPAIDEPESRQGSPSSLQAALN